MRWPLTPRLTAGLLTALVWALVAGSALFWGLRAGGTGQPAQAQLAGGPAVGAVPVDTRTVARVLGAPEPTQAAAPVPDVTSRLALRGIVTHEGRGAALIAVDGKPAKPVRVGAALEGVEGGWKVISLTPRTVLLRAGEQQARLEMPPLSARSSAGDAAAPMRAAPQPAPGQTPPGVVPQPSPTMPGQILPGAGMMPTPPAVGAAPPSIQH